MQLQSAELRARDPRGCESVATTPGSSVGLCDRVAAPIPMRGNRRGHIIMFRGTGVRRLPLGRRRQRSMLPAATVPPGAEVRATGSNTGISLIVSDDGNSSTCAGATTPSTCTSMVGWCIRCASREACTLPARSLEQPMNFCMSSWDGGAAVRSDPSTTAINFWLKSCSPSAMPHLFIIGPHSLCTRTDCTDSVQHRKYSGTDILAVGFRICLLVKLYLRALLRHTNT